ncbi:MAG: hypothetical protein ACT4P8_04560 [Betaproteobacteria bacterium]
MVWLLRKRTTILEWIALLTENPGANDKASGLPLPAVRCLTKEQAAAYLGIGVTLLGELGVPFGVELHLTVTTTSVHDSELDEELEELVAHHILPLLEAFIAVKPTERSHEGFMITHARLEG